MPDYKQKTVAGQSWQRACRIIIENPANGTPSIKFIEETAINIDGEVITLPVSSVGVALDVASPFPALDPATNQLIGRDITPGEVYAVLYSLYMDLAGKRDVAQ